MADKEYVSEQCVDMESVLLQEMGAIFLHKICFLLMLFSVGKKNRGRLIEEERMDWIY